MRGSATLPGAVALAATGMQLVVLVACGADEDGTAAAVVVRDSAGVEIVENRAPEWRDEEGWTVAPEPTLSVGSIEGEGPYAFSYVRDAALLPRGGVAVLDRDAAELRLFGADGTYRTTAGGPGEGPGELRFPDRVLVVRGDSLLVTQGYPVRLTLFTPGGRFARSWSPEGANGIDAVTSHLDLLTVGNKASGRYDGYERTRAALVYHDSTGAADTLVTAPGGDFAWRRLDEGAVYTERVPFGRTASAAFGVDHVHLGNGDRWEVARYALADGALTRSIRRDVEPRPVSDEAWERDWRAYLGSLSPEFLERREAAVREAQDRAHRLETMPAYDRLLMDPAGHLWVRRYTPLWEPSIEWDVLDPAGRWLGAVSFPQGLDVLEIGRDRVLGTVRDELDVMSVRVHALRR